MFYCHAIILCGRKKIMKSICEECGTLLLTMDRLKRQACLLGSWFPELKHNEALEKISKLHGYKDYSAARAALEKKDI